MEDNRPQNPSIQDIELAYAYNKYLSASKPLTFEEFCLEETPPEEIK